MRIVNETVMRDVIHRRSYIMLEKLAKHGITINTRHSLGNFPIEIVAKIGDSIILNLLLRNNASINATNHAWQIILHLVA